jgi:HD-GYP domain-containing protein (c-di-GMP phosphodiesterase class II)
LHDIGKIAIPDAILNKDGPLTDSEWTVMRTHPVRSAALVSAVPGLAHLAAAVRAEHERWDGKGYPDGLKGQQIPLASRITFVCDAYHAMTSDRPYRAALFTAQARAEIADGSGSQFCPDTAQAFLEIGSDCDRDDGSPHHA